MKYYDKHNNICEFDGYRYLDSGEKAYVYVKDDIAFKKFKVDTQRKYILKENVFKRLKNNNIDNFIELLDYYYIYTGINKLVGMDAYTYKFISKEDITLLYQDSEYLLDIVNMLEKTIEQFTKLNIKLFDCHGRNILFHENSATIIDPDMFSINIMKTKKSLLQENKKQLLNYVKNRLERELSEYDNNNYYNCAKLFNFDVKSDTDITKELQKTLKYKTIYDSIVQKQ